ncbi:ESCRT-II subunit protein VPS25 [Pneumocystis jirovecii RU7]|uniref:Vacuolar protein-sorting-associated protein 25 n=1 Tax=Pneumocystis jirovecii (strain RU7) TaxID=1408657 RepID=A0A0W4ZWN8_PNEJ7|nr:ESCRT-II subunit protein VPS25 [Pneumocystis jirovecii RU7]KTW32790.1 hypothetical protein T551_00275 [Pneumocystis jirovecii RU7]
MLECTHFDHEKASEFVFPPLYEFPPFFTRQPNAETWKSQQSHWVSLILAYCRHKRIFRLYVSQELLETELFFNNKIKRCVKMDMLKEILDFMENKHNGEWLDNNKKDIFFVYWRTLDEWADIMIHWIEKTGQRNTILTYYELIEGRALVNTELYKIDPIIFKKIIQVLVKKDMAQVLRGSNEDEFGVKFFGRI